MTSEKNKFTDSYLEFAAYQWKEFSSPLTKKFYKARRKEIKSKPHFVHYDRNTHTAYFKTTATSDKRKKYDMGVQFVGLEDAMKDLFNREGERKDPGSWDRVSQKMFDGLLKTVDIRMDCSCPAFTFQAHANELTQIDAAIKPNKDEGKGIWAKRHEKQAGMCKHILDLMIHIKPYRKQMLSLIKRKAKK